MASPTVMDTPPATPLATNGHAVRGRRRDLPLRLWHTVPLLLIGTAVCGQVVKDKLLKREIRFETGKWALSDEAIAALGPLCAEIAERDNYRIRLVGNTDSVGGHAYNLRLSLRRAEAVRAHLVACGAREELIETTGLSFTRPKASNATEEGKRENRRTTVLFWRTYHPMPALDAVETLRPGAVIDLQVLFVMDKTHFLPGALKRLDHTAKILAAYPDLHFEVLGWTALTRTPNNLCAQRAKVVYDHLKERGIAADRMTHKGMGGAGCGGDTPLQLCRRVEIAIKRNPYCSNPADSLEAGRVPSP